MPNPLQYLQYPGEVIAGAMTFIAFIMLWVRGNRDKDVKYVCGFYTATGITLLTLFGAIAPDNPVSSGFSSWIALVPFIAGANALYLVYKIWSISALGDDLLDIMLLGMTAMGYLTFACEFYLIGRDHSTSHWTGLVRRLPVAPLWVASALLLVTIVLVGRELWSTFTGYRRKLRRDREKAPK